MTLWKKAHLNENFFEIVRKISLILGLLVLILLVELYAKHYGCDQALLVKQTYYQNQVDELKIKQIQFSGGFGPRTYEWAAATYLSAAFFWRFF